MSWLDGDWGTAIFLELLPVLLVVAAICFGVGFAVAKLL